MTTLRLRDYHDFDLVETRRVAASRHPIRRLLAAIRRGWDDATYLHERLLDRHIL